MEVDLVGERFLSDSMVAVEDSKDMNLLIAACRCGVISDAQRALDDGYKVNERDSSGRTALHAALLAGHADTCLWLLSNGADPYIADNFGQDCGAWAEEVMVGEDILGKHYTGGKIMPDIESLAEHLDIAKEEYGKMLWIAEAALQAPLPSGWMETSNQKGELFYYNASTGESTWSHPMDVFYRRLAKRYRSMHQHEPEPASPTQARPDSTTSASVLPSPRATNNKEGPWPQTHPPESAVSSRMSTAATAVQGHVGLKDVNTMGRVRESEEWTVSEQVHEGSSMGNGANNRSNGESKGVNGTHTGAMKSRGSDKCTAKECFHSAPDDGFKVLYSENKSTPQTNTCRDSKLGTRAQDTAEQSTAISPTTKSYQPTSPEKQEQQHEQLQHDQELCNALLSLQPQTEHIPRASPHHQQASHVSPKQAKSNNEDVLMAKRMPVAEFEQKLSGMFQTLRGLKECGEGLKEYGRSVSSKSDRVYKAKSLLKDPFKVGEFMPAFVNLANSLNKIEVDLQAAQDLAAREESKRLELQDKMVGVRGNFTVHCRVRKVHEDKTVCFFPMEDTIAVADPEAPRNSAARKCFSFDKVFDPETTQKQVFREVWPIVSGLMDGCNVCVFAYGQTGTGKTYTMEGPAHDPGIHYRSVADLFRRADERRARGVDCTFKLSVMEIYNERLHDLLVDPITAEERRKAKHDLQVKYDSVAGVRVDGVTHITVEAVEEVIDIIELAGRNRCIGITSANKHSSRSHLIVTLSLETTDPYTMQTTTSKLNLVDLAGSERQSKAQTTGGGMTESKHINKSLSALHDVITALSNKTAHIPYRNSKLTQMLQDSLSGCSRVLMVVTVSPSPVDLRETISSLTLAKRVRSIKLEQGAKGEAEKTQYALINKENSTQINILNKRIEALEEQLKTALLAKEKSQIQEYPKINANSRKHEEERRRFEEDRAALIEATERARENARDCKERLAMLMQSGKNKEKSDGDETIGSEINEGNSNEEGSSVMGVGEGGRVEAWKVRAAELKRLTEEKDAAEKQLRLDLRARTLELDGLKEKLKLAELRLQQEKTVVDMISSGYDGRPLYERINDVPKLNLPLKSPARVPMAPKTDRSTTLCPTPTKTINTAPLTDRAMNHKRIPDSSSSRLQRLQDASSSPLARVRRLSRAGSGGLIPL